MLDISVRAKYVVASAEQIYSPGFIQIRDGVIATVGSGSNVPAEIDLPESVIIPGLINCHCHLEFSDIRVPIPPGDSFPDWISAVIKHRLSLISELSGEELQRHRQETFKKGIQEANCTGSAVVADIVSVPWQPNDLQSSLSQVTGANTSWPTTRLVVLPEILGLNEERFTQTFTWAEKLLANSKDLRSELLEIGLSPHAPYSVDIAMLRSALQKVNLERTMAIHVAESTDELDYLNTGQGAFRRSFDRLKLPVLNRRPNIRDMLTILASAARGLVIHGNFLQPNDIEFIQQKPHMSVVYCPRTHSHFAHPKHPCMTLFRHGIRTVLGTDSRASNPDLNLWSEVVEARAQHADITPELAFNMVTKHAAEALGIEANYGTLAVGNVGFLNVAKAPQGCSVESLLNELTQTPLTWQPLNQLTNR